MHLSFGFFDVFDPGQFQAIMGTVNAFFFGLLSCPGWATGEAPARDAFQPPSEFLAS